MCVYVKLLGKNQEVQKPTCRCPQWCSQGQNLKAKASSLKAKAWTFKAKAKAIILADRTVTSLTQQKDVHNII